LGSDRVVLLEDWTMRCQCVAGGFSPTPGLAANPLHTASALRAFRVTGQIATVETRSHAKWLGLALKRLCGPDSLPGPSDWLLQARLIVEAIRNLDCEFEFGIDYPERVMAAAVLRWRQSRRTVKDTVHLLQIMAGIETLNHPIATDLRNTWLPPHERSLASMKPEASLARIADLIEVMSLLLPEVFRDRASVHQVADNLSRTWGAREKSQTGEGTSSRGT